MALGEGATNRICEDGESVQALTDRRCFNRSPERLSSALLLRSVRQRTWTARSVGSLHAGAAKPSQK